MNNTKSEIMETADRLKDLVVRHSICYEIWPEYDLEGEQQVKVGYSLELYGTHDRGASSLTPGCERCSDTYRDLRRIADWILPRDERPSRYEIEPFDRALHESPKRHLRPEVELAVKILHRRDRLKPIDDCEERCRKEMEDKLHSIGVHRSTG